ncbi:SUMF1/EgtB/PvdO family nonheme iron enzyme [candidate division KSB1 bacterium]|nr:SUMF1/EgtB/PvdO family nonheme iron enzyme [candidate division KSB1 bacterium]
MRDSFTRKRLKNKYVYKYVLDERLGSGGMGIVYRARLMPVEKVVAIKLFYPPPDMFLPHQVQELRTRFIGEAHVMAKLDHKNVLGLYDFDIDEDENIPFYSMQLLHNSLGKMINEEEDFFNTTPLPETEVLNVAKQICDGLGYLHRQGVVHRDLKPGNILLTEDNVAKIADFGIAEIGWLNDSFRDGNFLSVHYCAPEQEDPEKSVDFRADLYSLGVTLYKLLTGQFPPPFYKSVKAFNDDLGSYWDEILQKALQQEPVDRFQDAFEFKNTLLQVKDEYAGMVKVPAGEFLFGKDNNKTLVDEFWIDKYPVTNEQYRAFMEAEKYPAPAFWDNDNFNRDNQPVVGVSWQDANAYAKWIGKRLPTEKEWEKAARGEDGRNYPWGNDVPDGGFCNHDELVRRTTDINRYDKNISPFGCRDMAGNVWEWTSDHMEGDEKKKIVKGGSWLSFPLQVCCSSRNAVDEQEKKDYLGFRCALDK